MRTAAIAVEHSTALGHTIDPSPCPSCLSAADQLLVRRLILRDPAAMADLYDQYGTLLYAIILRIVRNSATAEDLFQETLFRIWNRIHTFDDQRGRFDRWMITIARNHAIDFIRSLRHKPIETTTQPEEWDRYEFLTCHETETDRLVRQQFVFSALALLPSQQREILELTHFQGLTQTEIAHRLHKPLGTVKTLVRSALKILRSAPLYKRPIPISD